MRQNQNLTNLGQKCPPQNRRQPLTRFVIYHDLGIRAIRDPLTRVFKSHEWLNQVLLVQRHRGAVLDLYCHGSQDATRFGIREKDHAWLGIQDLPIIPVWISTVFLLTDGKKIDVRDRTHFLFQSFQAVFWEAQESIIPVFFLISLPRCFVGGVAHSHLDACRRFVIPSDQIDGLAVNIHRKSVNFDLQGAVPFRVLEFQSVHVDVEL